MGSHGDPELVAEVAGDLGIRGRLELEIERASVGSRPFCRARSPQIRSISSSERSVIGPDPRTRTLRMPRSRSLPHQTMLKRAAFGFRRFAHYRIRALLYAGKPNWNLLNSLTPR